MDARQAGSSQLMLAQRRVVGQWQFGKDVEGETLPQSRCDDRLREEVDSICNDPAPHL